MADPSPAADEQGQKPAPVEGQEPTGDTESSPQEEQGRTYSEAYVRQLRRESQNLRVRLGEVEERLQEREESDKTEQQKLTDRVAASERRAADSEQRLLRYEVAAERGLDPAAVKFLSGSTREELELRAEELAALLKDKAKPTAAGFDGGARQTVPEKGAPEQEHNRLLLAALGRTPGRAS